MKMNIHAKHLKLTPAISNYIHQKLKKIYRHTQDIIWIEIFLSVEKKQRHIAKFVMHRPGTTFETENEAIDLYTAIDGSINKIDLHFIKEKGRTKKHKKSTLRKKEASPIVLPSDIPNCDISEPDLLLEKIGEPEQIILKIMTLKEALKTINPKSKFIPFLNKHSNQINILFRKSNSSFGILEIIK